MLFSEPIWIIGIITAVLLILILAVMWMIYRRRRRIIKMGWLVNGTVVDIVARRGYKGNTYHMSVVEYHHHLSGRTTVEVFSVKKPRTNKKGSEVPLYYHPGKPSVVVLLNDHHTRVSIIILTILAIFVLAAGIFGIRFLLFETYRS